MERSEVPHDPRHLGVPSGASKTIFEPMVRLTQTVHLFYIKISTIPKQAELSLETRHLELPSVRPKRFLSRRHIWHKLYTYLAPTLTQSPNGREVRFHMTHIT